MGGYGEGRRVLLVCARVEEGLTLGIVSSNSFCESYARRFVKSLRVA